MLTDHPQLARILDNDLIGFITAVNGEGQPQPAPVWFVRDSEDIVIYNRPHTPRLASIAANPKVSFNLRGDRRAVGAVLIEGDAAVDATLPPAPEFPGYLAKYGREIERLGWTPEVFSNMYSTGLRLVVTKVRSWDLDALDSGG
jgi:PPOX class probable F420-dependent enzyme